MAVRNIREVSTPKAEPAARGSARAPMESVNDMARQQMALASECSAAVCRGFEAMRRIQEDAAHQAAERHAALAEKLRAADAPELLQLQAGVVRDSFASATRYWQDLAGAAMEMNSELMNCAARTVDTEDVFAASARFLHS